MTTLKERVGWWNFKYHSYPPLVYSDKSGREWIYGYWMLGRNYQRKRNYYGEYPPNYLDRIMTLFPEKEAHQILHLFSGSLGPEAPGFKFDIRSEITLGDGSVVRPGTCGDAHELSEYYNEQGLGLIIADPPYSEEDTLHYGTPMINRNKVVKECAKILKPGGFLVWLDQVWPMFRKDELELVGTIGVTISTNHRCRTVYIWRRL